MNTDDEALDRLALQRLAAMDANNTPERPSTYRVEVVDEACRITRHCGHDHATKEAAEECRAMLGRRPKWAGARVVRRGGKKV